MRVEKIFAIASLGLFVSCGGGGSGGSTNPANNINGKVADGYINGAIVFWDCNDNLRIDTGEISTTTGVNGIYSIPPSPAATCKLRAEVPSTAIDEDSPGKAIGASMTLAAIDGIPNFISPLTTIPALGVMSQSDLQTTLAGSTTSITDDHISAGNSGVQNHNAAKYIAEILKSIGGQIKIDNVTARSDIINSAFKKIPATAFTTSTPINSVTINNFTNTLPDFSISNPFTAFLGNATYVINENSLNGANDPRRATVQAALDAIRAYPEISNGANINWNMLPQSVKNTYSKISDKTIFPETTEETQIKQVILQLTQSTISAINQAHDQASREQNASMSRIVIEASSTSIQSALVLVPAANYITSKAKLPLTLNKIAKLSEKISKKTTILANITECSAGFTNALTYFKAANADGILLSEAGNSAKELLACGLALANSSQYQSAINMIALGETLSTDGKDLVKIAGDISDLVSSGLDVAQLSIPKALWDQTMLLTIKRKLWELEIQEAGDKSFTSMQAAMDIADDKFKKTLNNFGEELTHARLKPYIRMVAQKCSSDTILQDGYCVSPISTTVTSITFTSTTAGEVTTFAVEGTNLPTSRQLDITFNGCANIAVTLKSANLHKFTCTPQGAGTITVDIRATAGGTVLKSQQVTVKPALFNTTATVAITTISDDTGASSTDFITSDKTLTYSGTVAGFTANGDKVKLQLLAADDATVIATAYVDTSVTGTGAQNGTWTWDYSHTEQVDGKYTVRATIVDVPGNRVNTATGGQATQVVMIDTSAGTNPDNPDNGTDPNTTATVAITAISDDTGASSTDFITNDKTLTYSGTVAGFTANGDKVKLELLAADGVSLVATNYVTPTVTGTGAQNGTWTWAYQTEQDDGKYTVRATIVDVPGNRVNTGAGGQATRLVNVDTTR